jgi:hypothetical protein
VRVKYRRGAAQRTGLLFEQSSLSSWTSTRDSVIGPAHGNMMCSIPKDAI